jgi:AAA+ ATPase superfamily predicted ATPase
MKFYDREGEIKKLRTLTSLDKSTMIVIYGRRRVGKTRLVQHVFGIDSFYFFVTEKEERLILDDFRTILMERCDYVPNFTDFDDFFGFLFTLSDKEIFIFDEFQNFKKINTSVFSIIQKYWDKYQDERNYSFLFLGSYIGLMKHLFKDYKTPLFGRLDALFNLKPLQYDVCKDILMDLEISTFVEIYSIFGGVPKYYELLENVNDRKLMNIISEQFLDIGAPLLDEGTNILISEFGTQYRIYFSIIEAIASGASTLNDISNRTGIKNTSLGPYMSDLINEYEILVRKVPVNEKASKSKKGRYFIKDNFFKFWFRFIHKNRGFIESGRPEYVLSKIESELDQYIGPVFENICVEFLYRSNDEKKLQFVFRNIGSWWNRKGDEIDIVALNDDTKDILMGECKWNNRKMDVDILTKLKDKKNLIKWNLNARTEHYCLFSKSGFSKRLHDAAEDEDILLFTLDDLSK